MRFEKELEQLKALYRGGLFSKPYYSDRINGEQSFASYEEFIKIPFMDKNSIRETPIMERTGSGMGDIYGVFSSSGTTGNKTFYIYNKNDKAVHEEFVKTFFGELGINEEDLGGVMAPVGTGVMGHTMLWEFSTVGAGYVNCPEPSPENMINLVEEVPVTVIATRPNVVSLIASDPKWIRRARASKVKKLALGGGFLSEERRKLLEDCWGAECYNFFGMSEMFGPMAGECREKNGLHFLNQYLMIELVDPETKQPVEPGESGIAVYTSLWEKGFPLLRYWTDDMMQITYEPCACGSVYPRLHYLGRLADYYKMGSRYVFPEQVENLLFSSGLKFDYKVVQLEDRYVVYSEAAPDGQGISEADKNALQEQLDQMFESKTEVKIVPFRALEYPGVGTRFAKKI